MKIKKLTLIICSVILFYSCSKDEVVNKISYQVVKEGHLSYTEEAKIPKLYKVFESENDWMDFIPQIDRVHPDQAENLRNIDFDFTSNNLIIVIGEFFNYCCSEISIKRIYKKDNEIVVDFEESGPGGFTALSQAYLILQIQKDN